MTITIYIIIYNTGARNDILVDIFVLDTGVRSTHFEFEDITVTHLDDTFGDSEVFDGHGSHVAGIIVGKSVGVARGINIYEYPVCRIESSSGSTSCSSQDIEDGYQAVRDYMQLNSVSTNRRGVINLSFGTEGALPNHYKNSVNDALQEIIDVGGIPIAAAGNEQTDDCLSYPANSNKAISVGSHTENFEVSYFSNYGSCVDIYAPGSSILSAWHTGDKTYGIASGTSQATPVIVGIVAQLLGINSLLTFNEIKDLLQTNTQNIVLSSCPNTNNNPICYGISMGCTEMIEHVYIPTMDPTNSPTVLPTQPTLYPTKNPIGAPTIQPTNSPSFNPSYSPTNKPTNNPIPSPTQEPIELIPTIIPTDSPSDPYIYCCNPVYSYYASTCWPIADRTTCESKRRICSFNTYNCAFNFECISKGDICQRDSQCCSGNCRNRRGTLKCG